MPFPVLLMLATATLCLLAGLALIVTGWRE